MEGESHTFDAVPFDVEAAFKELESEAAPRQEWKPPRSTKQQRGSIQLFVPRRQQQQQQQRGGKDDLIPISANGNTACLGQKISVVWNLPDAPPEQQKSKPADEMDFFGTSGGGYSSTGSGTAAGSVSRELTIGLYRLGSLSNDKAVVTKSLNRVSRSRNNATGVESLTGNIDFYAPKMPGLHVFRLFDASTSDTSIETLATSVAVVVTALDGDWQTALMRMTEAVKDEKTGLALSMLQNIGDYGRYGRASSGAMDRNPSPEDERRVGHCKLLGDAVAGMLETLKGTVMANTDRLSAAIDEAESAKAEAAAAAAAAEGKEEGAAAASEADASGAASSATAAVSSSALKDLYQQHAHSLKLHSEGHDAFCALLRNPHTVRLLHRYQFLPEQQQQQQQQATFPASVLERLHHFTTRCYSHVLRRFFPSPEAVAAAERADLTFTPLPPLPTAALRYTSTDQMGLLERHIVQKVFLQSVQKPETEAAKEALRVRLQTMLRDAGAIGSDTRLAAFGSSVNGFGTDDADLDMCLVYDNGSGNNSSGSSTGEPTTPEERATLITRIGECLTEVGGFEVRQVRATARVPIVHFVAPLLDGRTLECDIACPNPLALRNTALLRLYSEIDPRVRPMAFFLKQWVKARDINDPGKGTLSSYGYILLLIHYLQQQQRIQGNNGSNSGGGNEPVIVAPVLPNLQQTGRVPAPPPHFQVPREHHEQWQAQSAAHAAQQARFTLRHPIDHLQCDTYFYTPSNAQQLHWLRTAAITTDAARAAGRNAVPNNTPLVLLLLGFFRYYAWEFDYRHQVVSINNTSSGNLPTVCTPQHPEAQPHGPLAAFCAPSSTSPAPMPTAPTTNGGHPPAMKADFSERYCWRMQTDRFCISDPFEPWYDIAHVIKPGKMAMMRAEFLRAYTILVRSLCDNRVPTTSHADQASAPDAEAEADVGDSLYLTDVIHNCIATSAELVQMQVNNINMSNASISANNANMPPPPPPNPTEIGSSIDPNYCTYAEMLVELLCEPVAVPEVVGEAAEVAPASADIQAAAAATA